MFNCFELCVFVSLQDDAAAGLWVVISTDFALVAVHVVDVALVFPLVVHLSDGDQLDCLPLKEREMEGFVLKENFQQHQSGSA